MYLRKTFLVIVAMTILLSTSTFQKAFSREEVLKKKIRKINREMMTDGDFEESISELNTMLEVFTENPQIFISLGLAHYGLMEYTKAHEYFKMAEEIGASRESKKLLSYAIVTIEENKKFLEKIENAKNAIKMLEGPEKDALREKIASMHFTMLSELLEQKYFYPALVAPHVIWLKENMTDLTGLHELSARVYYSASFYDKAIEDYKKAIEENPKDTKLYKTLADCQVAIGDFDNAGEYYQKAIDLYKEKGTKEDAQEAARLEKIKKVLPKKYGDISELIAKEHFIKAEEICKKRISLNSGDYAAITQLGQIYWRQEKRKAAIKLFRKVIKIVPDYPTAHFFLGKAYLFERKPEKGLREFNIFREKMDVLPEMDESTVDFYADALHEISYLHITLKQYREAKKIYKKIIKLKPDDPRTHFNLAACYYRYYHNRSRAYTELQKVIELDSPSRLADRAKLFIDFMRRNPDSRIIEDFSFLDED